MQLFWMTTQCHDEDRFVVSKSKRHAREFFGYSEGFEPRETKAEAVEDIPHQFAVEEGYADPDLLADLGFRVVSEVRPTIYAKAGKAYLYGCCNYSAFLGLVSQRCGVYCMRCAGSDYIKVGQTRDVFHRTKQLQTGCPYRLVLDFFIPCEIAHVLERQLHEHLSDFRTQREWFHVPELERREFYLFAQQLAFGKFQTTYCEYVIWSP